MQIDRDEQFGAADFDATMNGSDLDFGVDEATLLADPGLLDAPDEPDETPAEAKPARTYTGRVSQTVGLQKTLDATQIYRSEERRVGKEWRSRGAEYREQKKKRRRE